MSQTFSIRELTYSDTAIRLGLDNTPTNEVLINLQNLCQFILEPVRNHFDKPITITSGYRSSELCKAIGSSTTSQHTHGEAVDFEILGISNKEVSDWIVNHLDYDQCILEFWSPEQPNSGWVHCSYSNNNRKMYLRAYKGNGRTIYEVI
jgi:zinc D-Ala-D-Ala carboxypeptidase